jgi:hypothetical protein
MELNVDICLSPNRALMYPINDSIDTYFVNPIFIITIHTVLKATLVLTWLSFRHLSQIGT